MEREGGRFAVRSAPFLVGLFYGMVEYAPDTGAFIGCPLGSVAVGLWWSAPRTPSGR
jgi:hypothetical protein